MNEVSPQETRYDIIILSDENADPQARLRAMVGRTQALLNMWRSHFAAAEDPLLEATYPSGLKLRSDSAQHVQATVPQPDGDPLVYTYNGQAELLDSLGVERLSDQGELTPVEVNLLAAHADLAQQLHSVRRD